MDLARVLRWSAQGASDADVAGVTALQAAGLVVAFALSLVASGHFPFVWVGALTSFILLLSVRVPWPVVAVVRAGTVAAAAYAMVAVIRTPSEAALLATATAAAFPVF
jgi:hypothetical protein